MAPGEDVEDRVAALDVTPDLEQVLSVVPASGQHLAMLTRNRTVSMVLRRGRRQRAMPQLHVRSPNRMRVMANLPTAAERMEIKQLRKRTTNCVAPTRSSRPPACFRDRARPDRTK
jgi:hypothetical protein